jgi:hypothetical protein
VFSYTKHPQHTGSFSRKSPSTERVKIKKEEKKLGLRDRVDKKYKLEIYYTTMPFRSFNGGRTREREREGGGEES